jgi:hypothetical protein
MNIPFVGEGYNIPASQTRTLVFLGPSLSPDIAKTIFPEAWIHAPAKCGDILKAIRLSPHRIAIIDGYFEQTASLWHKEILFALSLGIEIFGASSMGALRALELEPYGMKGFGKIFQYLKETHSPNDDEVCLAHAADFSEQTPPLCNIRATLEKAEEESLINPEEKEKYLAQIQSLPYYQRSFSGLSKETTLIKFCLSHYVDQKKEDAMELLAHLAATPFAKSAHTTPFVPTLFFYKMFREMASSPFEKEYPWLPPSEKKAVKESGHRTADSQKRLSKLFHLSYDLARQTASPQATEESIVSWAQHMLSKKTPLKISKETLSEYLELYDSELKNQPILKNSTLVLLKTLISFLQDSGLTLYSEIYQQFSVYFRQKNQLDTQEKTLTWLKLHRRKTGREDSHEELTSFFNEFVYYMTPLYFLIDLNNGHYLGVSPSLAAIPWLRLSQIESSVMT